jgi:hypothetical protein
MKAWITKYALTDGIQEIECELAQTRPNMIVGVDKFRMSYFHKPYWHLTRDGAERHARVLQERKLISLRKSIARIEKLSF